MTLLDEANEVLDDAVVMRRRIHRHMLRIRDNPLHRRLVGRHIQIVIAKRQHFPHAAHQLRQCRAWRRPQVIDLDPIRRQVVTHAQRWNPGEAGDRHNSGAGNVLDRFNDGDCEAGDCGQKRHDSRRAVIRTVRWWN